MGTVELETRKVSGNPWGSYGLLFCLQDIHDFYLLVIDTEGYYQVVKRIADDWFEIVDWTYSESLNRGQGASNTLKVSYEAAESKFFLEFNGIPERSLVDRAFTGGYPGLFVEVLPEEYEDFPDKPVDVRFRFTSSVGITVYPTEGLSTDESGAADSFWVKLDTCPAGDVSVGLSSSDIEEGVVTPTSLLFTAENWSVPQAVTVSGVDDGVLDGDREYVIVTGAASSTDPAYEDLDAPDVRVTNLDNELPPEAPTDLEATAISSQQIDLTWIDCSSDEDGFAIERKPAPLGAYVQLAEVEAGCTSYSDNSVTIKANIIYVYRVRAIKDFGGSAYSNEASVTCKVTDAAPGLGDDFGVQVAVDGDYAVIGSNAASRVYRRVQANAWEPGASFPVTGALSISGDYAAVCENGALHIYHRTGPDTWDSGTLLTAPAGDWIRWRVAISPDYAVAGNTTYNYVYVFRRIGENSWDTGTKLMAPDGYAGDNFGYSVGIDDEYIVVGAPGALTEDCVPWEEPGAVYVFHRTGDNAWDSATKLISPNAPRGEGLGQVVSISGDYVIAATKWCFTGYHHQVYVFHRTDNNSWSSGVSLEAADAPPSGDEYGISVAICGNYAVVGARWDDDRGNAAGAAYVFERTGINSWDSATKLFAPDGRAHDEFGISTSISGDYVFIGAPSADAGGVSGGAVYVFY